MKEKLSTLHTTRAENPGRISEILAKRTRRKLIRGDGKLFIIAADHPARGALGVGNDAHAMSSRYLLLERLAIALGRPGVDGVLGSADIIDDLALLGLLDDKIIVGSMNRGGLKGASFEMDDRFTAYDIDSIKRNGLDFAKTLLRINLQDPSSSSTLEATARAVNDAVAAQIPIMLEPFMSHWVNDVVKNDLSTEATILSIAIAAGLGNSSAYTWLKIPVVPDMARVMEATTLPALLLGGAPSEDQDAAFDSWERALALPGVRGMVVGRSLLYPSDGNVEGAIDTAVQLVHGSTVRNSYGDSESRAK